MATYTMHINGTGQLYTYCSRKWAELATGTFKSLA